MLSITKIIIKNKKLIIRLIWVIYLLAILFFIFATSNFTPLRWDYLGRKSARLSVTLFLLVITPGIIKRLELKGLFTDIQLVLMTFRRQLGIGMYLTAIMHSLWIRNLSLLQRGLPITPTNPHQTAGTIAILLTAPLFLTSNDFSQKKLGRFWDTLHKLVYLAHWAIFAHVALAPTDQRLRASIIFIFAITEIISFIKKSKTRKIKPTTVDNLEVPSSPHPELSQNEDALP